MNKTGALLCYAFISLSHLLSLSQFFDKWRRDRHFADNMTTVERDGRFIHATA